MAFMPAFRAVSLAKRSKSDATASVHKLRKHGERVYDENLVVRQVNAPICLLIAVLGLVAQSHGADYLTFEHGDIKRSLRDCACGILHHRIEPLFPSGVVDCATKIIAHAVAETANLSDIKRVGFLYFH